MKGSTTQKRIEGLVKLYITVVNLLVICKSMNSRILPSIFSIFGKWKQTKVTQKSSVVFKLKSNDYTHTHTYVSTGLTLVLHYTELTCTKSAYFDSEGLSNSKQDLVQAFC